VASSAFQSMLIIWSERTAPETFMLAGIGTSMKCVCGLS
jgi:hypothetical protein